MAAKPKLAGSDDIVEHNYLVSLNPSCPADLGTVAITSSGERSNQSSTGPGAGVEGAGNRTKNIVIGSPDQWARDKHGELDWTYTRACVERWSGSELLLYLYKHAFSVPPRGLPNTTQLLRIRILQSDGLREGDIIELPRSYTLPLMFIGKYLWNAIVAALNVAASASSSTNGGGGPAAKDVSPSFSSPSHRTHLLHMVRLTHYLFSRAKVKARQSGMEKGWRCVTFDRLLARIYKHFYRSDPAGLENFARDYGQQEYEKDVFRHDWKRFCLRGSKGIKLAEGDFEHGITFRQFRSKLHYDSVTRDWILDSRYITSAISITLPPENDKPPQTSWVKTQEEEDHTILSQILQNPSSSVPGTNGSHNTIHLSDDPLPTSSVPVVIKLTPKKKRGRRSPSPHDSNSESTPGRTSKRFKIKTEVKAPELSEPSAFSFLEPSSSTPPAQKVRGPTIVVKPRPRPRPLPVPASASTMSRTLAAVANNPQFNTPSTSTSPLEEKSRSFTTVTSVVKDAAGSTAAKSPTSAVEPTTGASSSSLAGTAGIKLPIVPPVPVSPTPDFLTAVKAMSALVSPPSTLPTTEDWVPLSAAAASIRQGETITETVTLANMFTPKTRPRPRPRPIPKRGEQTTLDVLKSLKSPPACSSDTPRPSVSQTSPNDSASSTSNTQSSTIQQPTAVLKSAEPPNSPSTARAAAPSAALTTTGTPRNSTVAVVIERRTASQAKPPSTTLSSPGPKLSTQPAQTVQSVVDDRSESPIVKSHNGDSDPKAVNTNSEGEAGTQSLSPPSSAKEKDPATPDPTKDALSAETSTSASLVSPQVEDPGVNSQSKDPENATEKQPARSRSSSVEIINVSTTGANKSSTSSKPGRSTGTSSRGKRLGGVGREKHLAAENGSNHPDEGPAKKKRKVANASEGKNVLDDDATRRALELLVQLVEKPNPAGAEGRDEHEQLEKLKALVAPVAQDVTSLSEQLTDLKAKVDKIREEAETRGSTGVDKTSENDSSPSKSTSVPPNHARVAERAPGPPTPSIDDPEMRATLAIVVDNLVSAKMLSLNHTFQLLKSPHKPSDRDTDSTRIGSPSASLGASASVTSISNETSQSADSATINNLFDEIKAIREEGLAREERYKEEIHLMQQVHNAEVDALRGRLANLESRMGPFDMYDRSRHHSSTLPFSGCSSASAPLHAHSLTTSRTSEKRGREALDEESPLPIKSQRKQHIVAFSRGLSG